MAASPKTTSRMTKTTSRVSKIISGVTKKYTLAEVLCKNKKKKINIIVQEMWLAYHPMATAAHLRKLEKLPMLPHEIKRVNIVNNMKALCIYDKLSGYLEISTHDKDLTKAFTRMAKDRKFELGSRIV